MLSLKTLACALGGAALAALSLGVSPSLAQGAGPFAGLAGSWSGGGTVSLSSGASERIRCRATYAGGGSALQMNLRCASSSYNFNLTSNVQANGNAISGSWTETTRNASGGITGSVSGGQIQARVSGPTFTANLAVSTRSNSQSIVIRSAGTELTGVNISLNRT
jgi:hypothetical protein